MRELTEKEHEEAIIEWIRDSTSIELTAKELSKGVKFPKYGFYFEITSYDDVEGAKSKIYSIVVSCDGHPVHAVVIGNLEDRIDGANGYLEYNRMLVHMSILFGNLVSLQNLTKNTKEVCKS